MKMDDGLHIDDVHGDGGKVDVIIPPLHPNPTPQTREALKRQKPAMVIKVHISVNNNPSSKPPTYTLAHNDWTPNRTLAPVNPKP